MGEETASALSTVDVAAVQRRTLALLVVTQVLGGVGIATSVAVSALVAADLGGDTLAGLAGSCSVVGGALLAVPVAKAMDAHGRGTGLALGYAVGVAGAVTVVVSTVERSFLGAMLGMVLFGGATAANLQARYAATDLAPPGRRGSALSTVVWATTVGVVAGPNLAEPLGRAVSAGGLPPLAGPFVLAAAVFVLAAVATSVLLRPDPLLLARSLRGERPAEGSRRPGGSVGEALRWIAARPGARLGLTAITVGYAVMVAVMAMVPLHLHHGGASLTVIGVVVSVHLLGMYAASPVVGRAVDRLGRRPVLLIGVGLLLAALTVCGTASPRAPGQLGAGMTLLGLGFSCSLIAGSTLLGAAVPVEVRPAVQGTADLVMGVAAALAGVLAGVVLGMGTFGLLNAVTAVLVLVLALIAVRTPRASLAV